MYKKNVDIKKMSRSRIRKRIRKKISGTKEKPRVFVYKSNRYVYTQAIDDENGHILTSASTLEKEFGKNNKNMKKIDACKALGEVLSKRLKEKKIKKIVFDKGAYPYHGKVKALAEAMRKGGIEF